MALIAAALASIGFVGFLVSASAAYKSELRLEGFRRSIALIMSFVAGWGSSFGMAIVLNVVDDTTFAVGQVLSRAIGSGFWMALLGTAAGFFFGRRKRRTATPLSTRPDSPGEVQRP